MTRTNWPRRIGLAVTLALLTTTATSRWAGDSRDVPIDRILPNLERRLAKDPNNAHSHYLLGRVHGAAFARDDSSVRVKDDVDLESDEGDTKGDAGHELTLEGCGPISSTGLQWKAQRPPLAKEAHLTPSEACLHLTEAVRHLSRAVELAPNDPLYQLGLACAFDSGAHLAAQVDSTVIHPTLLEPLSEQEVIIADTVLEKLASEDVSERAAAEKRLTALGTRALTLLSTYRSDSIARRQVVVAKLLTSAWQDLAIKHFERAFALAFDTDKQHGPVLIDVRPDLVSFEAAGSYIRLIEARGVRNEAEGKRLVEIKAGLATLEAIPTWMTPILVPDESDATLSSLFDGASASFDLAGIRVHQNWPWPRANSSFLVWDPDCSGAITSGRQLFGSATWWMFFEDGYAALDALDDNDDGWLAGKELEGLALWRDTDRDGMSDAGEVETLCARGVFALATHADGIDGLSPTRSNGVVLDDGRTRPTFDWVTSPSPQQ